jgi:PII-like signaling protein
MALKLYHGAKKKEMKKYTLNIGLNDKDSKTQEINDIESCSRIIESLNESLIDGYTIYNANGFYTYENGAQVNEKTIIVEIVNEKKEKILKACNSIKRKLNQESILIQEYNIESMFI